MSDNPTNINFENKTRLSRRNFLRWTADALVGGTVGVIAGNEIVKAKDGIETSVGTFKPLYEAHEVGITIKDIPLNTDVYFKEGKFIDNLGNNVLFSATPEDIFTTNLVSHEVLNTLSHIESEVMLGDIDIGSSLMKGEKFETLKRIYSLATLGGIGVSSSSILMDKIPRRKLIRAFGMLAGAWGLTGLSAGLAATAGVFDDKEQTPKKRIAARISGFVTDFHPELAVAFFRNAIIASKMLSVAKETQPSHGTTVPQIIFQIGAGHGGIEDFIQVGEDTCQQIVVAYPKEFLNAVMPLNGGIEGFCTSRVFKFPKDHDFNSDVSIQISERKVIDEGLKKALIKVLTN